MSVQVSSVTRWLNYFSIFGHLKQRKIAQKNKIFTKVGSQFCQILIVTHEMAKKNLILPTWRNFAKSGHTASGTMAAQ